MKNLFKFSLCAFAALALANCTNDLDEGGMTPPAAEGFTMTINAGVGNEDADDSRTSIVYDGSTYHMAWNTSETQKEYLAIVEVADKTAGPLTKAEQKSGDEKVAVFQTTFPSVSDTGKTYDYLASYPYSESVSFDADGSKAHLTMPAEQTPAADGAVDPNSTLLFASHMGTAEGGRPYQIKLGFEHVAAYVKVAFKGLTLGLNESIDRIEFKVNDEETYIAGPCLFDYSNAEQANHTTTVEGEGSNTITLYVSALNLKAGDEESGYLVDDFELYFSALPAMIHDFTVTVVANNGRRYEKSVKTDKGLPFERGVIRTMSISNDGFATAKQKVYKKVAPGDVVPGNYLIVSQASTGTDQNAYVLKNTGENGSNLFGDKLEDAGFTPKDETTLLNADASSYTWTFTGSDAFKVASTSNKNYLNATRQSGDMSEYVPLTLGTADQTWKIGTYPYGSDNYRLTIENTTYSGDFIATNRSVVSGAFYSIHSNAWTQMYLYMETDDDDDVNDADKDKEYVYYTKATTLEAGKQYVISSEYDGIAYTMGNTGGTYMGIAVPIAQLISETTGFEKVNDNLIRRVESDTYVFTPMVNTSNAYAFQSAKESSYLRYSGGTFTLSTGTPTYFTVGNSGYAAFTVASGNFYMQPQRRESYLAVEWGCIQGTHDMTFWEITDAPAEGGGDEPEVDIPEYVWPAYQLTKTTSVATGKIYAIVYTDESGNSYILPNIGTDTTMEAVTLEDAQAFIDGDNILINSSQEDKYRILAENYYGGFGYVLNRPGLSGYSTRINYTNVSEGNLKYSGTGYFDFTYNGTGFRINTQNEAGYVYVDTDSKTWKVSKGKDNYNISIYEYSTIVSKDEY